MSDRDLADDLVKKVANKALWREVGNDLRWGAAKWWDQNHETLASLGEAELHDIANALRVGDRRGAVEAIVARMTEDEWVAYMRGTTAELTALAKRRAAAIEAFKQLGYFAAKSVAKAIIAALAA